MTVAELIAKLQDMPGERRVLIIADCDGHPADVAQILDTTLGQEVDEEDLDDGDNPNESIVALCA